MVPAVPAPCDIVVVSAEAISQRMPGPAIRAVEIGRQMARMGHPVYLLARSCSTAVPGCRVVALGSDFARQLLRSAPFVFGQGLNLRVSDLARVAGTLIVDLYDPLSFELLESARHESVDAWVLAKLATLQAFLLRRGDFFVCASERQRAYWLGQLSAHGRPTPEEYRTDPSLRSLLDLVPFGIPDEAPIQSGPGPRQLFDGIGDDDFLILWNGGLWNWLDPGTAIRAVEALEHSIPGVRLVFMGLSHPNPAVPVSAVASSARQMARDRGLLDRTVFFWNEWVPYHQRADFLLDADAIVALHRDTPEATLSFRTRLLDALWVGCPIVCSRGDFFSDLVESRQVGVTAVAEDVESVRDALASVYRDHRPADRAAIRAVGDELSWRLAVKPLRRLLQAPTERRRAGRRLRDSTGLAAKLAFEAVRHRRWSRIPQYVRGEIARLSGTRSRDT